jgi:N-acetylglucosamine-6-phosphate deacetylase
MFLDIERDRMESKDESLPWIAPGLVDLQINGYHGVDFNTIPIEMGSVEKVTRALWQEGVTSYYPTVITNGDESIEKALLSITEACSHDPVSNHGVAGIHLEGPFISPEDGPRGAHNRIYTKAPDWSLFQKWQEAAQGKIKIINLSPEWPESFVFIEKCVKQGVVVSIGHTAASAEQISKAVKAGAILSTHLGNMTVILEEKSFLHLREGCEVRVERILQMKGKYGITGDLMNLLTQSCSRGVQFAHLPMFPA